MEDAARTSVGGVCPELAISDNFAQPLRDWLVERHFDVLDSTQSYVEREYERFDQARLTAVSADFQTAGRGTRDRSWEALRGQSVLVTFYFRFPMECPTGFVNSNAPNVTKVLAFAVVKTLRWAASPDAPGGPPAAPRIGVKWPNDVVANGQKIAGVLARAVLSGSRLDGVIVGVGVNVNQSQADMHRISRPVWPATSLRAVTGGARLFDVEAVRRRLSAVFAEELRLFFDKGFSAFRQQINELEVLLGSKVRFRASEQEELEGTFEGVDDEGLIIIRAFDGLRKAFPSGEILP